VGAGGHRAGARARARADNQKKEAAQEKRNADFVKLQREAATIAMECTSLELLPATSLGVVTRYIFRALGLKHVTKVTASRDAMLINIERLGPARITELFEEPPNPPAQPAVYHRDYV
jgi:hypothetical protein